MDFSELGGLDDGAFLLKFMLMSIAQIEAELDTMSAEDLRQLALRSWATFVAKEHGEPQTNMCDEDDPVLIAALDEAGRRADASGPRGLSGDELRAKIRQWTTK